MPTSKRKEEGLEACRNKRAVGKLALEQRVNDLILEALTWPDNARELYLEIKRATERRAEAVKNGKNAGVVVKIRAEIRRLETQLRRHVDFISRAGTVAPRSLLDDIEWLERRLKVLRAEPARWRRFTLSRQMRRRSGLSWGRQPGLLRQATRQSAGTSTGRS